MDNCNKCENGTGCTQCDGGFNFINGSCQPNVNGLNNCITYTEDLSVCMVCEEGYYISAVAGGCEPCSGC